MTSVGTGVGGNVGGPSIPLQRDIETTAWTEVNKAALGIVHDSIEQAFSQINPRYSTGYLGGFGYKSAAENPLLDHPLEAMILSQPFQQNNVSWQLTYENLVNQLPPDLLIRFMNENDKPFEQRKLSFLALDNLLLTTAKVLAQILYLGQAHQLSSLEETRTALNILLPFAALKGAIANGNEMILAAKDFLMMQGANYRYFDGFNHLLHELQTSLTLMEKVNMSLTQTENGQLSLQAKIAAERAANQLSAIASQLEKISLGNDLQMLIGTIKSLEIVATALTLPNTQTAPLFLSLSLASIGLYTSESPLGLIGSHYESLINQLSQGLISSLMPLKNKGGNELLALMTTASLTTFITLAAMSVNSGLGLYPIRDNHSLNATHFFAFEAAVHLMASSGFLEIFYKEIIDAAGGDLKAQGLGSSILAQIANFLIILSGSIASQHSPQSLIESEASYLLHGIHSAEQIEEGAKSDQNAALAIALKLFSLSLEAKEHENFLDAYRDFLENLNISHETLQQDINQVNNMGKTITSLSTLENLNPHLTGIMNII